MIGAETLKPGSFNRHLISRKQKKTGFKRVVVAGLMLTSMVDMFSLLVIFLLQSFSNSPEVMVLSKGLSLPSAISGAAPIDAPVLVVAKDFVSLDQKQVGETRAALANPQTLINHLNLIKKNWVNTHPDQAFPGDIHLQADKELSSTMISQYINILISQGYAAVHLAVTAGRAQ